MNADYERLGNGEARVPRGWQAALAIAASILVAIGVVLLIAKAAGFARVRDSLAEAEPTWFFVCFFAEVGAFAAYAVVVRESLRWRGGPEPGLGLSMHVTLASLGAIRIVAVGGAGGLAVTYWCFRRARFSREEALVRVLSLNTLVYVVFGAGAWIAALLATLGVLGDAPLALTAPWLVVIPFCVVAARFVTEEGRVERLTRSGGSILRRGFGYAVAGTARVRDMLPSRGGRGVLAAATVYWAGDVICVWAALHSVGHPLPVAELVLAYATGYAAIMLPLPFGGVGGVDAAMTFALTAVGVPLAPALVAVAVYRLFGFWVPTIPALAALVLLPRAGRGLEQAAEAPA